MLVAVFGAVEQIAFIFADWRKQGREGGIDFYMAGRAGTASPAQGKQFVDPGIADNLHQRRAVAGLQIPFFTVARRDDDNRHAFISPEKLLADQAPKRT
ncbi:hypothetical protein GCM10011494_21860 [Novosphingobium endophyticum]|uniref:Uncharacterized protein n=1 Tax=Novosphingobium endophyticum TaxID=1955250 RepID=A0A916X5R0_9SPHN|nr:hypothetical protein GCM10011494_21860 [Novosphingobium endophyticum]